MAKLASPIDLKYFLEIAKRKNLTRASERLGISQPTLSLSLKRLEDDLKMPLVVRERIGIYLTKEGEKFASLAADLLVQWEKIGSELQAESQEISGVLRIGCHPSVARYTLPTVLTKVMHENPKLQVRLHHDLSRRVLDLLISGNIDCALVMNPVPHGELIMKKILNDEMTLFQSPKNKNPNVLIYDPELIQSQNLLQSLKAFGKKTGIEFTRTLESSNLEVIARMVHAGCGVGYLPTRVAGLIHSPELMRVAQAPVVQDQLYFAYKASDRNIKRIKVVLNELSF